MDKELKKEARRLRMDFEALRSGGFIKKTQKIPRKEIRIAEQRKKDYLSKRRLP